MILLLTVLRLLGQIYPYQPPYPHSGGSAITVTTSGSGATAGTGTSAITSGTNGTAFSCAAGKVAAVFVQIYSTGTISVTDSAANSGWTAYGSLYTGANGGFGQWFVNLNLPNAITSVTANLAANQAYWGHVDSCISGATGNKDFTQVSSNGLSTTITSGTFTTGHAVEIVLMGFLGGSTPQVLTATTPWVLGINQDYSPALAYEYQAFTTIQTGATAVGTQPVNNGYDTLTIGIY